MWEQETILSVLTGPAGVPARSHVGEEYGQELTENVQKILTSKYIGGEVIYIIDNCKE